MFHLINFLNVSRLQFLIPRPWAAFVIGIFGGCAYHLFSLLLKKYSIDDAIDASSVHLAGVQILLFNGMEGV